MPVSRPGGAIRNGGSNRAVCLVFLTFSVRAVFYHLIEILGKFLTGFVGFLGTLYWVVPTMKTSSSLWNPSISVSNWFTIECSTPLPV